MGALKSLLLSNASPLFVLIFSSALLLIMMSPTAAEIPAGFISIDCGGADRVTGARTNLTWVTDDGYITTGESATVRDAANKKNTLLQTVRYFTERFPKHCYELSPVQEGRAYIVRASFYYGNYDGKETMPEVSLIVDATVMVDQVYDDKIYELYVPAKSNFISVCLARAVSAVTGNPFISYLELRPLPLGTTYDIVALQQGFGLQSVITVDLGSNDLLRYPYDTLDRIWSSYATPNNSNVSTTHEILVSTLDLGPPIMLQTAISATDFPSIIGPVSSKDKFHVIMYFSEFSPDVTGPGQRVFDIYSNVWEQGSQPWAPNVDIYNLSGGQFKGVEIYSRQPVTPVNDSILFSFKSSPNSTHGPIISGIQVLGLTAEPLSNLTSSDDARTIRDVRDYYGINGSFGDPCMPVSFSWTWTDCTLFKDTPRITSISLSRWSLKGVIYNQFDKLLSLTEIHLDGNDLAGTIAEFDSLSDLEVLDLSENQLTGPIPEFRSLKKLQTLNLQNNKLSGPIPSTLSNLPRLKKLFLANNQLEGEVPPSLLAKFKAGTLNLTYGGNTKLTCNGESCDAFMAPPLPPPSPLIDNTPPPPVVKSSPSSNAPILKVSTLSAPVVLLLMFGWLAVRDTI